MGVAWPIRATYCSRCRRRSRSPGSQRSWFGFAAAAAGNPDRVRTLLRSPRVQVSERESWAGLALTTRRLASRSDRRIVVRVEPHEPPARRTKRRQRGRRATLLGSRP